MTLVLPTFHPATVLHGSGEAAPIIEIDLARARKLAEHGFVDSLRRIIVWADDEDPEIKARNIARRVRDAIVWMDALPRSPDAPPVALDLETTGLDATTCQIRSCALSPMGADYGISFPLDQAIAQPHRANLWAALRRWLDSLAPKLIQNVAFDIVVLTARGAKVRGAVWDLLPLHQVACPELEHSLEFIAAQYNDVTSWKEDFRRVARRKSTPVKDLLLYNSEDAIQTQRAFPHVWRQIQDEDLARVAEVVNGCALLSCRMSLAGVFVHEPTRKRLADELQQARDRSIERIKSALGKPDWNLHRDPDRRLLLYDYLKLPVLEYTEARSEPSTARSAYATSLHLPLVLDFLRANERHKLLSTFVAKLPTRVDARGRVHPSWNVTGTKGGRWSSAAPNMQNVPMELRGMFQAPPGRVLVGGDSNAIELRIQAAFAGAKKLIERFRAKIDVHTESTREIFGAALFDTLDALARKGLRVLTKRVAYASCYGADSDTIHDNLQQDPKLPVEARALLTSERVDAILRGFYINNPEIVDYHDELLAFANTHGYLVFPPLGRKNFFPVVPVDRNACFNRPIQGAAGDYMNLSLRRAEAALPVNALILLNVHDQMVVECDEDDGDRVKSIVEESMNFEVPGPAGIVELLAEAKIGRTWAEVG